MPAIAVALLALAAGPVLAAASWSAAGPLNLARTAFAAATLADGSVLVAGGAPGALVGTQPSATARTWTPGPRREPFRPVGRAMHSSR